MFRFEHTHALSQTQYVALFGVLASGRPRQLRRITTLAIAVACLFSPYTLLLGVTILSLAAVAMFMPHYLPRTAARMYRETVYLHGPVTYGLDQDTLWVRAAGLSADVTWEHLTVWQERGGWFILRGNGFPMLLYPVDALKADGLYEDVRRLAERHGAEFGTRRGRRGRLTNRFKRTGYAGR